MKTLVVCPALFLTALFLLTPHRVSGQSANKPAPDASASEQVLRDILSEVHLLRVEMLRTSANTYRSQVVLSRIKVEQDHLTRVTREINDIQDRLGAIKVEQAQKKQTLEDLRKKKDVGTVSPEQVNLVALELEELEQREQTLQLRDAQTTSELNSARSKLAELDARLDEIERDMMAPAANSDTKPVKRPQ